MMSDRKFGSTRYKISRYSDSCHPIYTNRRTKQKKLASKLLVSHDNRGKWYISSIDAYRKAMDCWKVLSLHQVIRHASILPGCFFVCPPISSASSCFGDIVYQPKSLCPLSRNSSLSHKRLDSDCIRRENGFRGP